MKVRIRRAGLKDLDLLLEWRLEVLRDVFSIPPDRSLEELKKENYLYYKKALQSGEHIACFAYLDDEIVGCGGVCLFNEMPSPDNLNGKCAYLMNIYTRPEFRGLGVGKTVVEWLVERAEDKNATKIFLETSKTGRGLYQKLGFVEMPDMMILSKKYKKKRKF